MKVQICSDLHLEFASNRNWIKENPLTALGDILVIAGDTYYLGKDYAELDFIKRVADQFEAVYLIPGNHEYYGDFDIKNGGEPLQVDIKNNVFLVNNKTIKRGEVSLIFSTMWSKIEKHPLTVHYGLNDFRVIKYDNRAFTINDYNQIHQECFDFIEEEIKKPGKKIVVTHHLPSEACNVSEFKGSVLNEGFCVDKTHLIKNSAIDYWIYGHSHRNKTDFLIGNTQMVTNQLGYIDYSESNTFLLDKVIELE